MKGKREKRTDAAPVVAIFLAIIMASAVIASCYAMASEPRPSEVKKAIVLEVGDAAEEAAEPRTNRTYLGRYYITGYDICVECCGKTDGITASGAKAALGRTVAAPPEIPFGTVLYIEGIGERTVEDRGGGVKGEHLDVLCENHEACYAITGWRDVYLIEKEAGE